MTSTSGILRARQRYGKIYQRHRDWLLTYDAWNLRKKQAHQNEKLRRFIQFAEHHSPFYKDLLSDIPPTAVSKNEGLSAIPYVEKETFRTEIERIYTVSKKASAQHQTGGTTGKPLIVRYTLEDQMRRMALLDHFKSKHGFENRKMLKATFSGKRIVPHSQSKNVFWRYNLPVKQILYSTFHLNDESIEFYVDHLNKMKPLALDGYVNSMVDVARFIEQHRLPVQFQPVAIFPTAETVTSDHRQLLERVFNCRVYDQYASAEGAPLVTECAQGSMHMELSSGIIENLPNSDEILVTSFHTHGTPLIRYRIGDSMKLNLSGGCACGLEGPLVDSILGRSNDFLLRPDGAKINNVQITGLLRRLPDVLDQVQFIQRVVGEVEVLVTLTDRTYRERVDEALRQQMLQVFGHDTIVRTSYVEHIPRAASGKHRLVQNLLN